MLVKGLEKFAVSAINPNTIALATGLTTIRAKNATGAAKSMTPWPEPVRTAAANSTMTNFAKIAIWTKTTSMKKTNKMKKTWMESVS
jgi:hypothetical protein